jgi:hypothetical protein
MSESPSAAAEPAHESDAQGATLMSTGNDEVDGILDALTRLEQLPVADQVAVYEQVHGQLRAVLARPPAE